jgi:protein-disulfide isomerase
MSRGRGSRTTLLRLLPLVPIVAAAVLSTLSLLGVCTGGCVETSLYRLFGAPLPPVGIAFFALCAIACILGNRYGIFRVALAALLFGALGAETVFVWIQKFDIGKWCELCLGIALSVATACALVVPDLFSGTAVKLPDGERKPEMKRFAGKIALILLAFLAGLGTSAMGLKKTDAYASGMSLQSIAFGVVDSPSEVYIVTDWFCPSCRIAEPEILKGAQLAMKRAKVVFVDYPIHRETLNYIPYNLSFMVREKEKYLRIREALDALSRKTKEPMPEDVQAAVSPLGVKYVPLNYVDVLTGTQYYISLMQKYKVSATPTVVVTDSRTGKQKTLSGSVEITSDNLLKALDEVSEK